MSDNEFDILDELYFVVAYSDLRSSLAFSDEDICEGLKSLLEKGYIKILYPDQDTEQDYNQEAFEKHYKDYYYLATKSGLVVHNSI
ncbi:hypothetical protein ACFSKU_15345 [Pontibacter silvestris]|uniref:Uncharacterized protein n=1 Tax=Pontibacter silvestris TaxID=2305183 RepID=A0ABW4X2R4_9BACT|nr:hypothetical protein [Pontibacter silvestris]MCC9137501.1 hypothetical protein [Pontibacter silvestris]